MLEQDFDNLTQQQNMLKQKIDQLANEGEKLQLLFTNRDQLLGTFVVRTFFCKTGNEVFCLTSILDFHWFHRSHLSSQTSGFSKAPELAKPDPSFLKETLINVNQI